MKKIVLMIMVLIVCSFSVSATIYYVDSVTGDDSDNGLSEANAWETITKANTLSFTNGDVLNFTGEFRFPTDDYLDPDSGADGAMNVYTSYGGGATFLGSYEANDVANWTDEGSNIWNSTNTFATDIGNIIFDDSSIGNRTETLVEISKQGDFFYEDVNNNVYIYSVGNPATVYSDIELAQKTSMITIGGYHHILYDGLNLKYGGQHGFSMSTGANNITIQNCNISFIGGGEAGLPTRLGNGVEVWRGDGDIIVQNNSIWEIFDGGITNQASDGTDYNLTKVTFRYNQIWNVEYGYEFFQSDNESNVTNVSVNHNTFYNMGGGLFSDQRVSSQNGRCIRGGNDYNISWFNFTDNICYVADEYVYGLFTTFGEILNVDYNLLYRDVTTGLSSGFMLYNNTEYNFTDYQIETSLDTNSIEGNPLFTDVGNQNFTPQWNSPACSMASDGGDVGALPCGPTPPTLSENITQTSKEMIQDFQYTILDIIRWFAIIIIAVIGGLLFVIFKNPNADYLGNIGLLALAVLSAGLILVIIVTMLTVISNSL